MQEPISRPCFYLIK